MAEPKMNPNSQEQMMLVQSFEQMADAVGAEIPVNLSSEIAAVKAGKRMSGELQRMLAEGSMSLMNQLNPEMMPETEMSYEVDGRKERMSPEMMDSLIRSGQVTPDEMSTYMVDGRMERMSPEMMDNMVSSGQISRSVDRMKPEDEDPDSRLIRMIRSGQISEGEAAMGMPGPGMMPSQDSINYSPSSGVTMEPNVMTLEEAVDAGLVTPTRPRMRPAAPMQSPRPQARPMR